MNTKKIKISIWALLTAMLTIVTVMLLALSQIKSFNAKTRTVTVGEKNDDIEIIITAGDGWQKIFPVDFSFPEEFEKGVFSRVNGEGQKISFGRTYEFKVKNLSKYIISEWTMSLKAPEDLYVNKAWNGEIEFHQFGGKYSDTFNTMKVGVDDVSIDAVALDELVIFPVAKNDVFTYHPSENYYETPIFSPKKSNSKYTETTIGIILYTANEDIELSGIEFNYKLKNKLTSYPIFYILIVIFIVLVFIMTINIVQLVMNKKFDSYKTKAEQEAKETNKQLNKQREELYLRMNIIRAISEIYENVVSISLETGKYDIFHVEEEFVETLRGNTKDIRTVFDSITEFLVDEGYHRAFYKFNEITTWKERLKSRESDFIEVKDKNGDWVRVILIVAQRDSEGQVTHVIYAAQQINEQKKSEIALQEALDLAEKANAEKTKFLFNMSHDIRTPMNAIIGFTNLLEKNINDEEKRQNYIDKIKISNNYLLSLINNVLEMARIESGKITLNEKAWNINQFGESIFSVVEQDMKKKNLTFNKEIKVNHEYVFCDSTKLREIILNLLSNAVKYTLEGGTVSFSLKEIYSEKPDEVIYQTIIEDTGIGISEEFLPELFEEFSREKKAAESKIEGTGLGLSITKRLVEIMNGTITVESRVGVGTRFIITLPHRIATKENTIKSKEKTYDLSKEDYSGYRILFAEDNDLNAEITEEILKDAGFYIERARDGQECVDKLARTKEKFDLILMDIQMPNMDGYEATKTIRNMADYVKASTPIIAMTANAFEEDKQNAIEAGMNGHISKPISISKLMDTLKNILK